MDTTILFPHISINVSDIGRSIGFYSALFGTEPVKVRPGYAKFELQNPKLNFTLNEKKSVSYSPDAPLNHFGFQVASTDDIRSMNIRLQKLGLHTVSEEQTVCCYALQDKIWVNDPDGISWEVFVVHSDVGAYCNPEQPTICCMPVPRNLSTAIAA